MDDLWCDNEMQLHGNPHDFPNFYQTVMNDILTVINMKYFEANQLDSKKYLSNPDLRKYVKDFGFELFGEISSQLVEPMESYLLIECFIQFVINQVEPKEIKKKR